MELEGGILVNPIHIVVLLLPVIGQEAFPFLARPEDRTRFTTRDRVVIRNLETGADRQLYRSPRPSGHIPYPLAISPDGRYLAFIEVVSQTAVGKRRLTVIDRSGRIVAALGESSIYGARGIREHIWCCGSHRLAVIVGPLSHDELPTGQSSALPDGLSVIDVRTGAVVAHVQNLRLPQQIHWAAFDSALYIKDIRDVRPGTPSPAAWPIYRYHVPTARLTKTARAGVFFSPDGRYYFDIGAGELSGSSFRLYRADDDRDVTALLPVQPHHLGAEGGWLPNAPHLLVFIEKPAPQPRRTEEPRRFATRAAARASRLHPDRWNLLVDVEAAQILKRFQGDIEAGWRSHPPALPVERRDGVELLQPGRSAP